jgi:hypothetical protein
MVINRAVRTYGCTGSNGYIAFDNGIGANGNIFIYPGRGINNCRWVNRLNHGCSVLLLSSFFTRFSMESSRVLKLGRRGMIRDTFSQILWGMWGIPETTLPGGTSAATPA